MILLFRLVSHIRFSRYKAVLVSRYYLSYDEQRTVYNNTRKKTYERAPSSGVFRPRLLNIHSFLSEVNHDENHNFSTISHKNQNDIICEAE